MMCLLNKPTNINTQTSKYTMSKVRFKGASISIDQALLILMKNYRKDPEAMQELKRLYGTRLKTSKDRQLLAKWMNDPLLHTQTSPKQPKAKGKDVLKHGRVTVPLKQEVSVEEAPAKGWNIKPHSVNEYLEHLKTGNHILPLDAQFTALRHAVRDVHNIAEIAAATGETTLRKLVTYPVLRVALFETVALIETEIRYETDDELLNFIKDIYRNQVRPLLRNHLDLQNQCLREARKIASEALAAEGGDVPSSERGAVPYARDAQKLYETVCKRAKTGKYRVGTYLHTIQRESSGHLIDDHEEALKEITLWALSDHIYRDLVQAQIHELVAPVIQACIQDRHSPYVALSTNSGPQRHSFMLAGAPACGKGTIAALLARYAEAELGVVWSDLAKINTDVHRQVVSHDDITGHDKVISVHLNGDEASYITIRAYSLIKAKIEKGQAPHLLMDGADPSVERLELGTQAEGSLHLLVVTTPVSVSIERAYLRGLTTGRYVLTQYMLNAHKMVSEQLFPRLGQFLGKRVEFSIFDTHVPAHLPPKLLMEGELQDGEVEIYDHEGMAKFYGKRHINTGSKSRSQLFRTPKYEKDYTFIDAIQKAGLLYYEEPVEVWSNDKAPRKMR
jgi:hypothetical protein